MDIKTKHSIGEVIQFQEHGNVFYDVIEKIVIQEGSIGYKTRNFGYDILTRKEHLISDEQIVCSYLEKTKSS